MSTWSTSTTPSGSRRIRPALPFLGIHPDRTNPPRLAQWSYHDDADSPTTQPRALSSFKHCFPFSENPRVTTTTSAAYLARSKEGLTHAITVSGSVSPGIGSLAVTVDVVWDENGGFDIMATGSGGVGFVTPGGNIAGGYTGTNANSVTDLTGPSLTITKGGYLGLGAESQTTFGKGYQGQAVLIGVGTPGAEVTGTIDFTISARESVQAVGQAIQGGVNQAEQSTGSFLSGANIAIRRLLNSRGYRY